jgi:hypothetical protein
MLQINQAQHAPRTLHNDLLGRCKSAFTVPLSLRKENLLNQNYNGDGLPPSNQTKKLPEPAAFHNQISWTISTFAKEYLTLLSIRG